MQKFYYLRNDDGRVVLTVCVLSFRGFTARGVAILSAKDTYHKKRARAIALGRAEKALGAMNNAGPVLRNEPISEIMRLHLLPSTRLGFYNIGREWYKSYTNPELTDFERRLFSSRPAHTRPNLKPYQHERLAVG